MKMKSKLSIALLCVLFLAAFVAANLIVKQFGSYGLWFSSFLLIPFDYTCRCIIHERLKGLRLVLVLLCLTLAAATATMYVNYEARDIAIASICGFLAAQIGASTYYQSNIEESWFRKVNLSDLIAIVFDSIVFQLVAFRTFNVGVTCGQVCIKFAGGLLWYYIIFVRLQLHKKLLPRKKNKPTGALIEFHEPLF